MIRFSLFHHRLAQSHLSLRSSSNVNQQFEEAQKRVKTLTRDVKNEMKLKIYALYKQGTIGKNITDKPGTFDVVERSLWDAWNILGNMTREDAQKKYISLVYELLVAEQQPGLIAVTGIGIRSKYADLEILMKSGLRIIKLNRPDKKNAITTQMYIDIPSALKEAAEDNQTVVTVLTGTGDYYCSGNDLSNFANCDAFDIPKAAADAAEVLKKFVAAFIDFPKILIAVVNGPAIGIAVTTLGLCDAVYSTDKATFQTPFTSLGQSAEGCSTYIFPRIMGHSRASELLYFNRIISAHEARDWGLVTEVLPDNMLQKEIWPRLQQMSKLPVKSLVYSKQLVRANILKTLHTSNNKECERLVERWQSEDCMKAILNFMNTKSKL